MPAPIVCAAIEPTAVGAWLTLTAMVCVAVEPCPSSAVTDTVAVPAAIGVMVTVDPEMLAFATPASDDEAVYTRPSLSPSLNLPLTFRLLGLSVTSNFCAAMEPTVWTGWLGLRGDTATLMGLLTDNSPSLTVTVSVVLPIRLGIIVNIEPDKLKLTLLGSDARTV